MKMSTHLLSRLRALPASAFLRLAYLNETGHILHLKSPLRFNEKLNWLKLYGGGAAWSQYVDKLAVREHVRRVLGEQYLVPLIARYDSVDEIDWNALPRRFVIKCTHGSHCGLICPDKTRLSIADAEDKLRKWMGRNWFWFGRETPYKTIQPRIMVEQFIGDDAPAQDYKLMCFNGQPRIIQVHTKRGREHAIDFFNLSGQKLEMRKQGHPNSTLRCLPPSTTCALIPVAQRLAVGFSYVRIDLYLHHDKVYFGEMTFFDSAALLEFEPEPINLILGEMIELPAEAAISQPNRGGILSKRNHIGYAPRVS